MFFTLTQVVLTPSKCYQDHKKMLTIVALGHMLD